MKKKSLWRLLSLCIILQVSGISCNERTENLSTPYNPQKPIVLKSFIPKEGGMASRVVLTAENLGNDPSILKVYFNDKRAPVIGCDKGKALVVTPRQPGETNTISVVIGKDSVVFDEKFTYRISTVVSTLVGTKGSNEFKAGSFAEAKFVTPMYLMTDNEKNIFLSHWGGDEPGGGNVVMISQQSNMVTELTHGSGSTTVPTTDITGRIIMIPADAGDDYFMYDPDAQWTTRRRRILHPNAEEQASGMKDFKIDWKQGFALSKNDGMIYTRSWSGQLIKFNPATRVGQLVVDNLMPNTDSYLAADPLNPHMLYISYRNKHCIYTYNILTGEHKRFAGTMGLSGWKDGKLEDALFNQPCQMVFDINNNIVVADRNNHCIRKITQDGVVTTLVGYGGKAGYKDGNPDDALFNLPSGVTIDKDYVIYIADAGNNCIRKLSIE